jgi:type II secretory pathway pseudopilin PulG
MRKKSQSGFTLVEVLATSAILMINIMALTSVWLSVKQAMTRIQKVGNKEVLVNNFIQDVRVQVENYQMFFDHDSELGYVPLTGGNESSRSFLRPEKLGLVWNGVNVYDKVQEIEGQSVSCDTCPGLMGFVVQPFSLPGSAPVRGLYRVRMRQVNKELGRNEMKEFLFVNR